MAVIDAVDTPVAAASRSAVGRRLLPVWPVLCAALLVWAWAWADSASRTAVDAVWLGGFLAHAVVGAVLLVLRPGHVVGRLFLAAGTCATAAAALDTWALDALASGDAGREVGAALLAQNLLWVHAVLLALVLPLLAYPHGRLPSRRWRPVVGAVVVLLVALTGALAVAPGTFDGSHGVRNPFGVSAFGPWPQHVADVLTWLVPLVPAAAVASLVVRWRRSAGVERLRLAWVVVAGVTALVLLGVAALSAGSGPLHVVRVVALGLALAALPVGTSLGVLAVGLLEIDVVLDRLLVYALLTGAVLGCYAAVLAAATTLLGTDASGGAALVASALVAVALSPVKDRLHRLVDRALFGDRSRPYELLAGVARSLHDEASVHPLVDATASTVAAALRLPYLRVVPDAADDGVRPDDAETLELVAQGRRLGVLIVGLRPGERRLSPAERELLADVARQLATALSLGQLGEEVEASRERIVRAREAERLRVRRDLHDGVGPVLAAVALRLDALGDHVDPDDATAVGLLRHAREQVGQSIGEVRRVVEGLRPAALDELGLVGVLHEQAETLRLSGTEVEVVVRVDPAVVRDPAAEVAAHLVLVEAVSNVVRHAGARTARLELRQDAGGLVLVVADDGRGVGRGRVGGVGLASMRERSAELGGSTTISTGPSGTTVTTSLPAVGDE